MIDPVEVVQTRTFAECENRLVRMRRAIRHSLALRDSWVEHSRIARRALSRLNGEGGVHLISVRRAIGAQHAEARKRIREANAVLREGGQHLIRIGDVIDRSATFEQRCKLLGVNPADREELPPDTRFAAIIGLGFEASAQYRIDGSQRGPLLGVLWPLIVDAMCELRGDLGGRAMRYRLRPSGSMAKVEPAARLLSAVRSDRVEKQ